MAKDGQPIEPTRRAISARHALPQTQQQDQARSQAGFSSSDAIAHGAKDPQPETTKRRSQDLRMLEEAEVFAHEGSVQPRPRQTSDLRASRIRLAGRLGRIGEGARPRVLRDVLKRGCVESRAGLDLKKPARFCDGCNVRFPNPAHSTRDGSCPWETAGIGNVSQDPPVCDGACGGRLTPRPSNLDQPGVKVPSVAYGRS